MFTKKKKSGPVKTMLNIFNQNNNSLQCTQTYLIKIIGFINGDQNRKEID